MAGQAVCGLAVVLVIMLYNGAGACLFRNCTTIENTNGTLVYSCVNAGCTEIPLDENLDIDVDIVELYHNDITTIPKLNLKNLFSLNLAYNKINNIAEGAFEECKNYLQYLNLSRNYLGSEQMIDDKFKGPKLKMLDLSYNKIQYINESFFLFHSNNDLEMLDLSHNEMIDINPTALNHHEAIISLHLSHNNLNNLTKDHFSGMWTLKYLYLDDNKLTTLPDNVFSGLYMLMLDLRYNEISSLTSDTFFGMNSLEVLHLSHNSLTAISTELFAHLISLQDIYIEYNPIDNITANAFPDTIRKISISSSSDKLKSIPNGTFSGLTKLKEVYIQHNMHLTTIEAGAFDMDKSSVEVMYLNDNALWSVDEKLVNWPRVKAADLSGNRWDCDCHLVWMRQGDLRRNIVDMVVCSSPLSLKGRRVSEIEDSQLSCDFLKRHKYEGAVALIIMVSILFVTLLVILAYKFRTKVLPCWFGATRNYETLYETDEVDDDEEEGGHVTFNTKSSVANDRVGFRLANGEGPRPTPV